jgi:hypothetical protein
MSLLWPASSRPDSIALALCAAAVVLGTAAPSPARAEPPATVLLFKAPAQPDAASWRARLARRLGPLAGHTPVQDAMTPAGSVVRERLQALASIETLLQQAHAQAAALAEDQALATLAQAAGIAEQLGDVPGACAWDAEVQLSLGLTAAQAGLLELAEGAFRRAVTLDPGRKLLQAEAAPAVLELYERVARQQAMVPRGELEVRSDTPGALVYLDDAAHGAAPARARLSVGRHALRVEAPGYQPYGALIDVLEGQRPPIVVRLSLEPRLERARALEAAAARGDYAGVAAALREVGSLEPKDGNVAVLETSAGGDKALLVRCDAGGCRGPLRVLGGALQQRTEGSRLDADGLAAERAWLNETGSGDQVVASSAPWWRRWYVWGGLAAVGAIATGLALSVDQAAPQRLRVVVAPGDLRP